MSLSDMLFKAVMNRAPRVRGMTKKYYFSHSFLDAWFAWFPLNQIQYDGAAVGEIYNAASRIKERAGSTSWIAEWSAEGERVQQLAEVLVSENHNFSASNAFLRAYTYFRTAHLAIDPGNKNEEMRETYKNLSYCFERFRELSGLPIEKIKVPFLVMAGENELGGEGIRQAHEFYDRLGSKIKEKRIITEAECGEAHCQLNNFPLSRQIMFDWIEDHALG